MVVSVRTIYQLFREYPLVTSLPALWILIVAYVRCTVSQHRERKMSAMTSLLSHGTFPPRAGNVNHAINSCLFTKTLPSREEIKALLTDKLIKYRRFRSVPSGPYWREVTVDMKEHIQTETVPTQEALVNRIHAIVNSPLHHDLPVWRVILLRNEEVPTDSEYPTSPTVRVPPPFHCIMFRIGHCIGDGVSLVEVMSRLSCDYDGKPVESPAALVGLKRRADQHEKHRFGSQLVAYVPGLRWIVRAWHIFKAVAGVLTALPATVWMTNGPYDSNSAVTYPLEARKRGLRYCENQKIACGGNWSLDYVKRVKDTLGVSMNDIFMGAFAGALREYMRERGDTIPKRIRALVAYAFLRRPKVYQDAQRALSNKFTLLSAPLAVNGETRLDRVLETQKFTQRLKHSMQPVANTLVNSLGAAVLPSAIVRSLLLETYSRHSFVFANVPGAPFKVRVCGHVVEEIQIIFAGILPQVEVFTYAGRVHMSFTTDPQIIGDPQRIVDLFAEELRDMGRDLGFDPDGLDVPIGTEVTAPPPDSCSFFSSEASRSMSRSDYD